MIREIYRTRQGDRGEGESGLKPSPDFGQLWQYWNQAPSTLIPDLRRRQKNGEVVWTYRPINLTVMKGPSKNLPVQTPILRELLDRLTHESLGNRLVGFPDSSTPKEDYPDVMIVMGDGKLGEYQNIFADFMRLPTPRGLSLFINTVPELPPDISMDQGIDQIVRGLGQNAIIFEANPIDEVPKRALWISMQGNRAYLNGDPDSIFNQAALRVLDHCAPNWVTHRMNADPSENPLFWAQWAASEVHKQIWERAQAFFKANLIENEIDLTKHANRLHVLAIQRALNKSGFGKSMRGAYDHDLGVLAVTPSGRGKVEWSYDPDKHYLVPVSHLTPDGYVVKMPWGSPQGISYADASVETNQAARLIIVSQLAKMGIKDQDAIEAWMRDYFARNNNMIPVRLMDDFGDVHFDHTHWIPQPGTIQNSNIETYVPDYTKVPVRDGACGSEGTAQASESTFLQSSSYTEPHSDGSPLGGRTVIGIEPGHGMMALAETSQEIVNAVTRDMQVMEALGI